jgi:hypothetical protein
MGPYAGASYNLPLCRLLSRLQHIYHGQPYARVDFNPMLESTLSPSQGLRIWPKGSYFPVNKEGVYMCMNKLYVSVYYLCKVLSY